MAKPCSTDPVLLGPDVPLFCPPPPQNALSRLCITFPPPFHCQVHFLLLLVAIPQNPASVGQGSPSPQCYLISWCTNVLYGMLATLLAGAEATAPEEQQVWITPSVCKLKGDRAAIKGSPGQSSPPSNAKIPIISPHSATHIHMTIPIIAFRILCCFRG